MILELALVMMFIITPFMIFFAYKAQPIAKEFSSYEFKQIP